MKKYSHLTQRQRFIIADMRAVGKTYTEIAKELSIHRTTISREISRNQNSYGEYNALGAQRYAEGRRQCPFERRRKIEGVLEEIIIEKLNLRWSPEQISGRLKVESEWRISHESIYRWIYTMAPDFKEALRRYRGRYAKRGRRKLRKIAGAPRKFIELRPVRANERLETGHWERDLLEGRRSGHSLLVLNDRKSRLTKITKVLTHATSEVGSKTLSVLKGMDVKSLTNDNGVEFGHHEKLEKELITNIYFTNPYTSWERGTVENTNGLLRQFFPKGCDLSEVKDENIIEIEEMLNNRPRKTLNYSTPAEIHYSKVTSLIKSNAAYKKQRSQRIIEEDNLFWSNLAEGKLI